MYKSHILWNSNKNTPYLINLIEIIDYLLILKVLKIIKSIHNKFKSNKLTLSWDNVSQNVTEVGQECWWPEMQGYLHFCWKMWSDNF